MKLITLNTLEAWNACHEGRALFMELFPNGAHLSNVLSTLTRHYYVSVDNIPMDKILLGFFSSIDLAQWLWKKSAADEDFCDQVCLLDICGCLYRCARTPSKGIYVFSLDYCDRTHNEITLTIIKYPAKTVS